MAGSDRMVKCPRGPLARTEWPTFIVEKRPTGEAASLDTAKMQFHAAVALGRVRD
jgi:hypothetical protein